MATTRMMRIWGVSIKFSLISSFCKKSSQNFDGINTNELMRHCGEMDNTLPPFLMKCAISSRRFLLHVKMQLPLEKPTVKGSLILQAPNGNNEHPVCSAIGDFASCQNHQK